MTSSTGPNGQANHQPSPVPDPEADFVRAGNDVHAHDAGKSQSREFDFWFDFSSPYGYLMSECIDQVASRHGRTVRWRPFLLGPVYKVIGSQPLPSVPMKGSYSLHDIERSARFLGLPWRLPDVFPVATQHAARAYYWLEDLDLKLARRFAHATFRHYFVEGRDISPAHVVVELAASVGADREALDAALGSEPVKERLKAVCAEAIEKKVFGSPYVVIDGEPFWGADRLPQIERWLAEGGF